MFRWTLFRDILRVGAVAALITVSTNLTIAIATGLVGQFGPAAIAGYGTGSRLEYLLIPLVFGLGGPLVAMVGTNIGAGRARPRLAHRLDRRRHRRRAVRDRSASVRRLSRTPGCRCSTTNAAMLDAGSRYLRVVGPFYGLFGLGMALYFASQGAGRLAWPLIANLTRLAIAAVGGSLALRLSGDLDERLCCARGCARDVRPDQRGRGCGRRVVRSRAFALVAAGPGQGRAAHDVVNCLEARLVRSTRAQEIFLMTSQHSVVLAEPVRTAIGTFGGSLKDVPAANLGAVAIAAAVKRAGLRPDEIETVVMGNVVQAGAKMNPARQAAVHAGLPVTTPAMTVNRVCGSGAQAIVSAAQEILLGNINVAVAGGMENLDLAPYLIPGGRWGYRMGDGALYDSMLRDGLNDAFSDAHSGWHTEDLVEKYQVTREAQDRWALRSQQRFAERAGCRPFQSQIVSVDVPGKKGPTQFDKDEHNRPDTTLEALARLKPAFRPNGTITAGNAPGLNDAAAAMVLADENMGREARSSCGRASRLLRHCGG